MKRFDQMTTYPQSKFSDKKAIFIGIGRSDVNYVYAFHSLLMHRRMGAAVTLEIWRDQGHAIPESGSPGLVQWFKLRVSSEDELKKLAEQKTRGAFDVAVKLPSLEQYFVLRDLSATPFVKLFGETWKKRIDMRIAALQKDKKVEYESRAYSLMQKSLSRELTYKKSEDLEKVRRGYLMIKESYGDSAESVLIDKDIARAEQLYKLVSQREAEFKSQQAKISKEKKEEAKDPTESDKDRIPRNPFDR
jgi:hypothetical protein